MSQGTRGSAGCRNVSLNAAYSGAGRALSSLIDKGTGRTERAAGNARPLWPRAPLLSQAGKVDRRNSGRCWIPCCRRSETKKYGAFLLHGITGSGKTEVYLRAAEEAIASGRSVLVLVPEIALATQLEGHFYSRFGDLIALVHSGLSAGERLDQWQRIADGSAMVVIGARSAIFAPLADPGSDRR